MLCICILMGLKNIAKELSRFVKKKPHCDEIEFKSTKLKDCFAGKCIAEYIIDETQLK
jgi:hypothetical protein